MSESNLLPPTLIIRNHTTPIVTKHLPAVAFDIGKPNPYIYVLSHDGENVCFSSSMRELRKVIEIRMGVLGLSYTGRHLSKDKYISDMVGMKDSNSTVINVYADYSNFLFQYNHIISEFEIRKIPHFRFELSKVV